MSKAGTIRLVLDQGVLRDAALLLRERGHECTHVSEIGMSVASDKDILAWSLEQKATVITLDADFHAILAVSGAAGPSVIRMRRQGLNALAVVDLVENVLAGFDFDLARGSLVTVKVNKTTCHKLPIGGM